MKRFKWIGLVVCLAGGSAWAQEYYIYVTAESDDEVAVVKFDGENATIEETITVGTMPTEIEGPHGITVSPDRKYWYLSMAHGMPYGWVYKFETGTNELVGEETLGLFPATMQVSPATGLLYVVNFNLHGRMEPSTVSVVDPETMTELEQIPQGVMPHGSRLSPDGLRHYSVAMMSGELFEIDAVTLEERRRLNLDAPEAKADEHHAHAGHAAGGGNTMAEMGGMAHSAVKPTWVTPHPIEPKVYIALNGADEVVEVDTDSWTVTRRFATGKAPYNVEVSPDGQTLVATYKGEAATGVWDLETGTERARVLNSREVTHGVVISPDNRYAFVSVEGIGGEPGSVDIIDLESGERVAVAEVGKQAGGIAFWKMTSP